VAAFTAAASDIRVVNGIPVDLEPIHAWTTAHHGPRPLKHWVNVRVAAITGAVSIQPKCKAVLENGSSVEIIANNLPASISNFLSDKIKTEARVKELTDFVDSETRRLRLAKPHTRRGNSNSPAYIQYQSDAANLENRRDELRKLQRALSAMTKKEKESTTDLAVDTGTKYSGLAIWDFGKKN